MATKTKPNKSPRPIINLIADGPLVYRDAYRLKSTIAGMERDGINVPDDFWTRLHSYQDQIRAIESYNVR